MAEERDQNQGNRRRRIISINSQIDKIQDASLRDYTQNLDRRISSLADRQSRLLNQLYDNIEREEKARLKESFNDRQEAMRQSLEEWRSYNQSIRSDLSLADRFAADVLYWNRRRNLRDLEREARYRFDDIAEEAENAANDISDSFSGVSDALREWSTALNVNSLASGLEDSQKSMRDIRVEMQRYVALSEEEWKNYREYSNQLSKNSDYAIANTEYLEKMTEVLKVYNDKDFASGIMEYSAKLGYFGVNPDQLAGLYDLSDYNSDMVNLAMSQMARIANTEGLGTSADQLASVISDNTDIIKLRAAGDSELAEQMMQSAMIIETASNANDINGLTDELFNIMNTPVSEWSTSMYALLGRQGADLLESGQIDEAAKLFATNLNKQLSMYSTDSARMEYLNSLKFSNTALAASLVDPQSLTDFLGSMEQVDTLLAEEATATEKFLDTWKNTGATRLEKLNNEFHTSAIGSTLDDISNELDITLAEGMLITSGLIDIGKLLGKGVKGIGSKLGLGGKGAAAASGAKSFLGFSSGGAGVINHTLLGSTGNAMMSGTGLLGGLANTGSSLVAAGGGGAVSGGAAAAAGGLSILGGVVGSASIIEGIVDIATASNEQTWQEEADKVTEGAIQIGGTAAAAGVGAAIGSIVPGIGTAVGALVGAGVGGLATLIWGDDWAQKLQDSLDGTDKINKAIEILNKNSEDLKVALDRDREFDNLMGKYNDLRMKMDSASEGTAEYKQLQEQLNGVVSDINAIYPGYIDLNNDDYELMDKQIEVTKKLADAELALYKARILTSGDEILEGVTNAYDQYSKSQEKSSDTISDADILGQWSDFWTNVQTGLDEGKWSIEGNSFVRGSATDSEWDYLMNNADAALSSMNYYNQDWLNDWVHLWGQGDETDLYGAWSVWNSAKGDLDYVFEDSAAAQADLLEKEATLANMLTTQMSQYESMMTAASWEDVAKNWSTADATDKSMLLQIGKLYNSVGSEFYKYLPDMMNLESLADTDLTGDGTVGHYAIGLDRVPYDNFAAYLHKDEAVLTAEEAEIWRQATAGWTPNDKSAALQSTGNVVINQIDVGPEEPDDASNEEIIDTLKWLVKEIKKSITDLKSEDDAKMNSNQLLQLMLKSRLNSSPSNNIFSFVR